jgi:hypothetical protein
MSEMTFHPDESGSTNIAPSGEKKAAPVDSFRTFPLRFDEFAFSHWYLFTLGLEGVLLLLAFASDIIKGFAIPAHDGLYYFLHEFHNSATYGVLTDWIYFSGVVAVSLIALAFNSWRKTIPTIFQEMPKHIRSLHGNGDVTEAYARFLMGYQRTLLSRKRSILLVAMFIICLALTWGNIRYVYDAFRYYSFLLPQSPLFGLLGMVQTLSYQVVGTILAVFLEGYIFVAGSWVLAVTGKYLKDLTLQFKFHIQPSHPDHCGGLSILGNFSFGMALPILILSLLLGLYALIGFSPLGEHLLEPIFATILLPLVLLLAGLAFFVPLWDIHRRMVEEKKTYNDNFAEWTAKLEQMIQSSIEGQAPIDPQALEKAKAAKEEMEVLQVLHPDNVKYPVWPFDRRILVAFLTPQIPAIISLLTDLVKHFFSL